MSHDCDLSRRELLRVQKRLFWKLILWILLSSDSNLVRSSILQFIEDILGFVSEFQSCAVLTWLHRTELTIISVILSVNWQVLGDHLHLLIIQLAPEMEVTATIKIWEKILTLDVIRVPSFLIRIEKVFCVQTLNWIVSFLSAVVLSPWWNLQNRIWLLCMGFLVAREQCLQPLTERFDPGRLLRY